LVLLGFAALVAVAACRLLPRAGWVYRAPRLGLAAWYAVLVAMAGSGVAAAAVMVVRWPQTWAQACTWWTWVIHVFRGDYGVFGLAIAVFAVALLLLVVARLVWSVVRAGRTVADHRRGHRALLSVVGHYRHDLGVTVVDHDRPAAYVVGGRAGRVVVTSAAVAQLPPAQLAAVVAHERAHAAGRHQLLVDAVRALALLAPRMLVFGLASAQVSRLVEIRADEVAAAEHGRLELARAIVACAQPSGETQFAGALAASGGDALERLNRLLTPPRPVRRMVVGAGGAGLLGLAAMPLLIVVASELVPVLRTCLGFSC
jgi:Zn-dependent protease with chaperone function